MSKPRVLVSGATGFLGPSVVAALQNVAKVITLARKHADVCADLASPGATAAAVAAAAPDYVLHLAAMARMIDCERDPSMAQRLNADAPGEIAVGFGPRFVLVSTDLVFDGCRAPYAPLDLPMPLSEYGMSKAAGERQVLAAGGRSTAAVVVWSRRKGARCNRHDSRCNRAGAAGHAVYQRVSNATARCRCGRRIAARTVRRARSAHRSSSWARTAVALGTRQLAVCAPWPAARSLGARRESGIQSAPRRFTRWHVQARTRPCGDVGGRVTGVKARHCCRATGSALGYVPDLSTEEVPWQAAFVALVWVW